MPLKFNYSARLSRVKSQLRNRRLDSLLVNNKKRIYYLCGYRGDDAFLLVTQKRCLLITDARYEQEIKELRGSMYEPVILSRGDNVYKLIDRIGIKKLAVEEAKLSYRSYLNIKKYTRATPVCGQEILDELIMIKDAQELKAIKKAIAYTAETFKYFRRMKKVGISERQAANKLKDHIYSLGAEPADYDIMVITATHTDSPHAASGEAKIKATDNLLIDLGVKIYGYNSDLTRVYCLSKIKKEYQEAFNIIRHTQQTIISLIRPGALISDIDKAARKLLGKHGLGKHFTHATGHGIGLEVHEKPYINARNHRPLEAGMVITIEPGIYFPGKFGIRLEDMVAVTKKGANVLSNDIPNSI